MRVVSLACSNTEIVCALGCADLLVGVDDHSDRPAEVVARLPRVGPDLQIDVAAVARLEPDLVLASLTVPGHENVVADLEGAGQPYLAPQPVSLEDVYRDIGSIAQALGVSERGEQLAAEMRAALAPTTLTSPRPTVLVQWWNRPTISPGRDSWVTDLIRAAGGCNPLAGEPVKSRPLSDEEVAALDPDIVILSWCGVAPEKVRPEVVFRNAQWQGVKALKTRQVHRIPEAFLGRPGPGLVTGFTRLNEIVTKVKSQGLAGNL